MQYAAWNCFYSYSIDIFQTFSFTLLTPSFLFEDRGLGLANLSSHQLQIRAWTAEDHLRRFLWFLLVHLPSLREEHRKAMAISRP